MRNLSKMAILATAIVLSTVMLWANIINEIEPANDQPSGAQTFQVTDTVRGQVTTLADIDRYKNNLAKGMYKVTIAYPQGINLKDWYEIKDAQGVNLPMDCYWPNSNTLVTYFKVCAAQTVFFNVLANQTTGLVGAPYEFKVEAVTEDPQECNDTNATARTVTDPGVQQGMFPIKDDVEVFQFSAEAGIFGFASNTPLQPGLPFKIELYQGNSSTPLASTASGTDLNTNLPTTGVYYLKLAYAQDTNSQFPYSASFLFTPSLVTACDTAVVGVVNSTKAGKTVTLNLTTQFTDSLSIAWGDGTVSDSTTHTYPNNGTYNLTITAFNDCSSATASTTVSILTARFKLVWLENQLPGAPAKLAFICEEGEAAASNFEAELETDWGKLALVGLQNGTLNVNGLQVNADPNSPGYGRIGGTFNANGSETITQGDTLFYIIFNTDNAQKGDSIAVNFDGTLSFAFYAFVLGAPQLIDSEVVPGGIEFVKDINLRINVQTPTSIPVDSVEVTITTPDTTLVAFTNANGLLDVTVPYSTNIVIKCYKQKQVLSGVSSVDAFYVNRVVVLLPVNAATPYAYVAADFNCSNSISTVDAIEILRYLVGITSAPPCEQLVFIDKAYSFPAYTGQASYFNYPTTVTLTNANPDVTANAEFVCAIRGDFDHNASPNLMGQGDASDRGSSRMTYTVDQSGTQYRVRLTPEESLAIAAGQFALQVPEGFQFQSASLLQGNGSSALAAHSPAAGRVNVAFANLQGSNILRDAAAPLMELVFEGKGDFDLVLDQTGLTAQFSDKQLNINGIQLERSEQPGTVTPALEVKCYPNPMTHTLAVTLPDLSQSTVQLFDATGRLVAEATTEGAYQLELQVSHLPSGTYRVQVMNATGRYDRSVIK